MIVRRLTAMVGLAALLLLPAGSAGAAQAPCQYVLGFAALHAALPMQVGSCRENQQYDAQGNATQRTYGGLLVWRKASNTTAFTDGYRTWVAGPGGLRQRLNSERFAWEPDAGAPGLLPVPSLQLTAPTIEQVDNIMGRTIEQTGANSHFALFTPLLMLPDGRGGSFTAAVGVRYPTADAYGQLLFFWHNGTFVGWNADRESVTIRLTPAGPAAVLATYAHYAANDPLCCPSLPPVHVTYTWNGARVVANGVPPAWGKQPITVKLT